MSNAQSPKARTPIEQKIKARNCALLLKNGSPKLRDLLRVQCRSRMRESRADTFANTRNLQLERKQLINTIVREELSSEIENDIELHDIILKEILDNFEQWQTEEYEKDFESVMDFSEDTSVICPVCEYNALSLEENIISCICGVRLYYSKSLVEFYDKVLNSCHIHEKAVGCTEKLKFFTEPRHGFKVLALNAACFNCDFFSPILELI